MHLHISFNAAVTALDRALLEHSRAAIINLAI